MMKLCSVFFINCLLLCFIPASSALAEVDFAAVSSKIIKQGEQHIAHYRLADAAITGNEFSSLYFDVFESSGMEFRLNTLNPEAKRQIEAGFSTLILSAMRGDEKSKVQQHWLHLKEQLLDVSSVSNEVTLASFMRSFFRVLVDGAEAIVLLIALMTYLRRFGAADKQYIVYWAVAAGLFASAIERVFSVAGGSHMVVGAITILLAAIVLLYLSVWMFLKRDKDCWELFIDGSLGQVLTNRNKLSIGLVVVLVVYYAGSKIAFSSQVLSSNNQLQGLLIVTAVLGVGSVLFYGYLQLSKKIAQRRFYIFTSGLMLTLATRASSKGLVDLQGLGIYLSL